MDRVQPKKPRAGWFTPDNAATVVERVKGAMGDILLADPEVWSHPRRELTAISTIERDGEGGQVWHVSVSRSDGNRASEGELAFVRGGFDMVDAREDNSAGRGTVRHLWLAAT